jgi:hypothetical protein
LPNPRGHVSFEAGGRTWTLVYSINALIEIEESLGVAVKDVGRILSSPDGVPLKTLRTLFRCGLVDHHPEVDDKTAGVLMSEIGLNGEAVEVMARALNAAFPPADPGAPQGAAGPLARPAASPPKPRGSRSMASGSKPALPLTPTGD